MSYILVNELLESLKFRFDRLYPLAKYRYINQELIERNDKNWMANYLILSRINRSNFNLHKRKFSVLDTITADGSMTLSFQRNQEIFKYVDTIDEYSKNFEVKDKLKTFSNIQNICSQYNIELFIVIPPNFSQKNKLFETRVKELTFNQYNIFAYNELDLRYKDSSFYSDQYHLKLNGAKIFTNQVANFISNLIYM